EGRRAGLDHLEAGELRAPVHVVGGEFRLGRPDLRLQPCRQIEVIAPTAEEGHGGVCMEIHESREGDLSFPVDHRVRFALLAEFNDSVSLDVHLGYVAFDLHIPDEDAHRIRSSAFATTVRVRSAFWRCVSRIFSNVSGSSTLPLQKLSTVQRKAYGIPSSDARVASEAIVMPTMSPIFVKCATSARVSSRGPVVCT